MPDQFPNNTISGKHLNRSLQYGNRVAMLAPWKDGRRVKEFVAYSWAERQRETDLVAYGLMALGLQPGDRVAAIGENSIRWIDAFFAPIIAGGITVTVYPTMTARDMGIILGDSGARFAFAANQGIADRVLSVKDKLPQLERIIRLDPVESALPAPQMSFDDFLRLGEKHADEAALHQRITAQQPDDIAVLIYTSGTTGEPKGVMLTHKNFISQETVLPLFNFTDRDIWLSHIPLCHSFGLSGDLLGSGEIGGTLALAPGIDPDEMRWALRSVRPTVLMSVPRLYEKMYLKIQSTLETKPPIARKIFAWAHGVGREMFKYTSESKTPPPALRAKFRLANRVLGRVRREAGFDRLRVAYAGGAPSSPQLVLFFQGLGLQLYQGYGLTETSPVVTVNRPGKNKLGSVGPAIPGAQIRIADDGEILLKGPMVMKGYWNKPEATAEAVSPDGWFHSGDIGHLDDDGYLFITDRKKELIVTSGGKNIAPTRIENLFNIDPFVEAAVVVGNDRKFLSALLCPNFEALERWAKQQGLAAMPSAELIQRPEVLALFQKSIDTVNAQLARFESIKKFALTDQVFSEATGELTATQKYKRRVIDEKFKDVIEGFYRE